MSERTVYRSREGAAIQIAVGIFSLAAIALPALLDPGEMNAAAQTFFVLLGVGLFALCLRCAWCAIRVEGDGIRVVNPLRSFRMNWSDIEAFTLDRWGILPRNCVIRGRDGSSEGVWAISARNPNFFKRDSAAEGLVAELNERLSRERTT